MVKNKLKNLMTFLKKEAPKTVNVKELFEEKFLDGERPFGLSRQKIIDVINNNP